MLLTLSLFRLVSLSPLRPRHARRDLAPADRGAFERAQHFLGEGARDFDQREPLEQLDCADRPAGDARLVGDRADNVGWPHAVIATGVDVQPGHAALWPEVARAAPAPAVALVLEALLLLLGQRVLGLHQRL